MNFKKAVNTLAILALGILLGISISKFPWGYRIDEANVQNRLLAGWILIMERTKDENLKTDLAYNIYGAIFQYWLISEHGTGPAMPSDMVRFNLGYAKDRVDLDDPMKLKMLYRDGTLTDVGKMRAASQILKNGDVVLNREDKYQKLVAQFRMWLAGLH